MTRSASSVLATVVVPLLVEFTAQFIHTFWGTMVTTYPATNDATNSLNGTETNGFDYLESVFMPAFQSGLSVWMQIVLFCKISVAHFNPAVSVGFLMAGMLHPVMFLAYVAVQCFSSTLAAYTTKALLGQIPSAVMVPDDVGTYSVLGSEMLLTGILVFFALAMVVDKTYDQHTGAMAVGFTVFQGLLCGKGLGVACLSPSRAFGPAVVVGGKAWDRHWLLWVADIAGAIVASIYYMVFFAPKAKSWLHRFVWKRIDTRKGGDEDFDGAKICEEKEMLQKS